MNIPGVRPVKFIWTTQQCCGSRSGSVNPDLDPWIRMFSGLQDLNPDQLVRGTDPDPDPSIIKQNLGRKTLISTVLLLFI